MKTECKIVFNVDMLMPQSSHFKKDYNTRLPGYILVLFCHIVHQCILNESGMHSFTWEIKVRCVQKKSE